MYSLWTQGEYRMSFLSGLYDKVKKKQAELKDRQEFLYLVEKQAKPIRRTAYMKQMLKEVVNEGVQKAKEDSAKKTVKKEKTASDFGLVEGINDPYRFLDPKKSKSKENKSK